MSDAVRDSYDAMAELYAQLFMSDLEGNTNARGWLAAFAKLAAGQSGVVADLGCGPGHITNYLNNLGLTVVGYDLSPGQISQARQAFDDLEFHVGDLAAIDATDSSIGGIVSRYSLIHLHPSRLSEVFSEWLRVLEPGAPVLVSFFGSRSADAHGTPFDHKVVAAYELFLPEVAQQLRDAGFTNIESGTLPPPEGGRPFEQATVLGLKPV